MHKITKKYIEKTPDDAEHLQHQNNFIKQLLPFALIEFRFFSSCKKLEDVIKNENNLPALLKTKGHNTLKTARKVVSRNQVSTKDMPLLTQSIKETTAVINDPSIENIKVLAATTKKINGINREWGKMMGGVLGSFIGSAIVVAAIATIPVVALASMGIGLPFSAMLIAIGASLIYASIPAARLTYKAGLFAHLKQKGSIAVAEQAFVKTAEKIALGH